MLTNSTLCNIYKIQLEDLDIEAINRMAEKFIGK